MRQFICRAQYMQLKYGHAIFTTHSSIPPVFAECTSFRNSDWAGHQTTVGWEKQAIF